MRYFVLALLVACSSATYQPVKMTNRTPRAIEAIYVFPSGAANHGSSRGKLAPNASMTVKVREGNVDVLAVSAVEQLEGKRERKEATQTLELRAPIELVFHDSTQTIVEGAGTIGVVFRILPP